MKFDFHAEARRRGEYIGSCWRTEPPWPPCLVCYSPIIFMGMGCMYIFSLLLSLLNSVFGLWITFWPEAKKKGSLSHGHVGEIGKGRRPFVSWEPLEARHGDSPRPLSTRSPEDRTPSWQQTGSARVVPVSIHFPAAHGGHQRTPDE